MKELAGEVEGRSRRLRPLGSTKELSESHGYLSIRCSCGRVKYRLIGVIDNRSAGVIVFIHPVRTMNIYICQNIPTWWVEVEQKVRRHRTHPLGIINIHN